MHLVLAIIEREALKRQGELFNGLALLHAITDEKDADHRFAGPNAVIRKVGDGVAIVREKDAFFGGRPGQDDWIRRRGEIDFVNADNFELGQFAHKPAQYVLVEVFVTDQFDHGANPWPGPEP